MGGGVLRTAAKAAVNGAFRSPIFDEAGRRIARQQVTSFSPAVDPSHFVPSLSAGHERAEVAAVAVAAHWPEFEFNEWELAGGSEDNVESVNSAPRLIFGPVPTLEEAEEATKDLKDGMEKVYFTSQHTRESDHEVCQDIHSGECSTVSSVPNHVLQMYSLLQTREAQDVVSSIASDKNVWDAMMNNEKVIQFFKNPAPAVAEIHEQLAESVAKNESADEFSPTMEAKETAGNSFLETCKIKISQMVSGISDFVKDFFGISTGDSSSSKGKSGSSFTDDTNAMLGASFLATAVAVILVVFLKRI